MSLKLMQSLRCRYVGGCWRMTTGRWMPISILMWSAVAAGCAAAPNDATAQSGEVLVAKDAEELIEFFTKFADRAADVLITDAEGNQVVLIHGQFAELVQPEGVRFPQEVSLNDLDAVSVAFSWTENPDCELKKQGGSWVLRPVGCSLD